MLEINTLYEGCCLEVMKRIDSQSIDLILSDLPYGSSACEWDNVIPWGSLWVQYKRIIKEKGAIVLTASQPFTSALILSQPRMFRYRWIWDKGQGANFQLAKLQPMNTVEDICVFSHSKTANGAENMNYFPIMEKRSKPTKSGGKPSTKLLHPNSMVALNKTYTESYPTSILRFSKHCTDRLHPTQKPVELFEYLIKTYTQEGDLVLDSCVGSGTTAIAAIKTKRNWIGIEKDPDWHMIAKKRIEEFTPGQLSSSSAIQEEPG